MNQHDKEIENAVLGGLLLEPHNLPNIASILKEEYFYQIENQFVYRAIKALYESGETVDILTVTQYLNKIGRLVEVGGAYYVSTLTNRIASATNIEYHTRIVHQMYILRQLSLLGNEITSLSQFQNADCFDLIDKINKRTSELTSVVNNSIKVVGDVFNEMVSQINEVIEKGLPTGMMSGLENLDKQTGGWQKGNLIIIAARPGMGKTALALHLAKYPAMALNKPVGIMSMEMTAIELVGRLASSESYVNATLINQKKINSEQLQKIGAECLKLVDAPIYIDETPSLTLDQLTSRAKKMYYDYKIELLVIDYIQLMQGESKGNREQEISHISRGLKGLAKQLGIPVIALSQLSRKVEERSDKRPMLSDLRESGAIEQDADMVAFLFRPEYYDMWTEGYEYGAKVLEQKNLMLFDIAKGRGLKICEVPLKFFGEFMEVRNYNLYEEQVSDIMSDLENNNDFL
ncbi:MAG: replicative DNA helicase [Bacteroidetes bacterium]|nr:replicative DNA helicase [Bacteroidota bacterium]